MFPRNICGWLVVAVVVGCSNEIPSEREKPVQPSGSAVLPLEVKDTSSYVKADIEISPSAQAQLAKIAKEVKGWRIRFECTPGGCTGFREQLEFDKGVLMPDDAVQKCGDFEVCFLKEQLPVVQGALIEWLGNEKETGFKVTYPNKTQENKVKTIRWVNEQMGKLIRKKDAADRAAGKLAERIDAMRKLASDDPKDELSRFRLGQMLMADDQFAEAAKSFEQCLSLAPDNPNTYRYLGECLIKLGEKDRAVEVLRRGHPIARKQQDEPYLSAIEDLLRSLGSPVPQE